MLGVPIDSLSMEEAVERIFLLVDEYRADGRPRLVCTVNTDFIVNTLRWSLHRSRHPELLGIMREADLVTADGMPVVWASRFLGPPIRERVTGADLVPVLAREAAGRGKSIYFLGGNAGSAAKAATVLGRLHPDLNIAGWDPTYVHTVGPELVHADEYDQGIIDRINASRADILLIAFGNPKQEIWFMLNRHRLMVPVSIGIGGTYDFISGSIPRAPLWMREYGLEWLFRFTQDPKRLWKRYLVDFAKFGLLVWPSVLLHQYMKMMILGGEAGERKGSGSCTAEIGGNRKVSTLVLPAIVDGETVSGMAERLSERPSSDLILDASNTAFVDSAGLAFIMGLLVLWERHGYQVLLVGMSGTLRWSLFCNRLGDLFEKRHCRTVHEARARLDEGPVKREFRVEHRDAGNTGSIRVSGDLRHVRSSSADAASLVSMVYQESCTIDLSGCTSVDTSGIIFLLKLRGALVRRGKRFTFTGITGDVKQMIKVTQVESLLMGP